jgi:hypothetical protein
MLARRNTWLGGKYFQADPIGVDRVLETHPKLRRRCLGLSIGPARYLQRRGLIVKESCRRQAGRKVGP